MAFLDNSGDILLDCVLTDTGRYRLAKGDGSFRVAKFALGDDEINYRLYDKSSTSGSAYYDLSILQTPILEAFTDNAASLKSKLMTISRNNLLYLPIIKLSTIEGNNKLNSNGTFMVAVDQNTIDDQTGIPLTSVEGLLDGVNPTGRHVRLDQGLDCNYAISPSSPLDADLVETQYIVEMDNRFGNIAAANTNSSARASYIDDDNIASYFFSLGSDTQYVADVGSTSTSNMAITGPRGTKIIFAIKASIELQTTTFLFDQLGATTTVNAKPVRFIDTTIRVTGATTGYRVDVPVRFIKLI